MHSMVAGTVVDVTPETSAQLAARLAARWFDEWSVGEVFETRSHRMDQGRMIEFAEEFDPQRFHIDVAAATESIYGGLIASGWHSTAVMMRLLTEFLGPSSIGASGIDRLRWVVPVRPNDEVRLRFIVLDVEPSVRKPDRGVVNARCELVNQDDIVVMSLEPRMLLLRRPNT